MRIRALVIPALCAAAAACAGEADSAAQWGGTMEDSSGVQLVMNTSRALWTESSRWGLEEVLTIGTAAGEPEYQFGQIAGVAVTSDGRILVVDQQAQHLKVFAPDGTYERTIGQAGSGPGEFGPGMAGVLVGRADTIIVPDMGNQRVNVLRLDDSDASSFRMSFERGIPARWDMTAAGDLVYQLRALNLPNTEQRDTLDLIARVTYGGELVDTLMTPARGRSFTFSDEGAPQRRVFSPEPVWALFGDDGICFAVNDAFRLSFYEDGSLVRVVTLPHEPKPVTEADIDFFMETVQRLLEEQGIPPEQIEIIKGTFGFADYFPAFLQFLPGPDGSLWVQRVQEPTGMTEEERESWNPLLDLGATVWDVFDEEGRYLGELPMPGRFQPVIFENDLMYGISRDEFDVQYVKVLRVTGLPAETA
jgi:hypothetical protein